MWSELFKNQLSYQVAKWSWSKISLRKSHSYPIHIPYVHSEASDSMASNGHSSRFRRHQSRNQAAAESAATSGLGKSAEHRSSGKKHHVTPPAKNIRKTAFMGSLWKFIIILGYFFLDWILLFSFFFGGGCSRQRVGWWEPWYLLDWLNKQLTRNSLCFTERRTVRFIETILKQFRDTQTHTACWWNQYVSKLIIFVWEILCLESNYPQHVVQ